MAEHSEPQLTRDGFVESAVLHFMATVVSSLYRGFPPASFEGDRHDGAYAHHNGSGDHFALEWDRTRLVALAFDHESDRSEFSSDPHHRDPYRHLAGLPAECVPLVERHLTGFMCERLVTAGLWTVDGRIVAPRDWNPMRCHGLDQLWNFGLSPRDAMFHAWQPWAELLGLTEAHGNVLLDVLERWRGVGPTALTHAERDALLVPPPDYVPPRDPSDAWAELARIGVSVPPR